MLKPTRQTRTYKADHFEIKVVDNKGNEGNKFANIWSNDGMVGVLAITLQELAQLGLLIEQVIASEHDRRNQ